MTEANVVSNENEAPQEELPGATPLEATATSNAGETDSKLQILQQQALTAVYAITGQKAHQNAVNLLAELAKLANTNLFTKFDENGNDGKPTGRSAIVFALYGDNELITRVQTGITEALNTK